jgi:hypothetical protein
VSSSTGHGIHGAKGPHFYPDPRRPTTWKEPAWTRGIGNLRHGIAPEQLFSWTPANTGEREDAALRLDASARRGPPAFGAARPPRGIAVKASPPPSASKEPLHLQRPLAAERLDRLFQQPAGKRHWEFKAQERVFTSAIKEGSPTQRRHPRQNGGCPPTS